MPRCLPVLLLGSLVSAQVAPDLLRHVPDDAIAVVRTVGLGGWGKGLGATGVGRMFAAPSLHEPAAALLKGLLAEVGVESESVDRLGELAVELKEHRGEVVVAAVCDVASATADSMPDFAVLFAVAGSDEELTTIERALREVLGEDGKERRIDGEAFVVHALDDCEITAPWRHGGASFVFLGHGLDRTIPKFLRERSEPHPAAAELQQGVFAARVEVQPLVGLLRTIVDIAGEEAANVPVGPLVELIGLSAIERVGMSIRADGEYFANEAHLEWRGAERGLFGVVLPARSERPQILDLVPAGARNWNTGLIDAEAALRLYARGFELFADVLPMSRQEIEHKFTELTKVRLVEDLLAHVGGEYLVVQDLAAVADLETEMPEQLEKLDERAGDSVFVLQLRDGAKLALNVEKALRARGMHAGRKSEEYAGTKVYRLLLLGSMPIEYAFSGDVFVLGVGDGEATKQNLRGVLDAVALRAKGQAKVDLRPEVLAKMKGWADGWASIDVGSLEEILDGVVGNFELAATTLAEAEIDDDVMPWVGPALDLAKRMRIEARRLGLDVALSAVWTGRDRVVVRSRW
ncbi:MAG: hypothetical protein JNK15_12315 [Planctomycetes bacterium]|nr:hypothetical protein [Planctomycetota bacterium]